MYGPGNLVSRETAHTANDLILRSSVPLPRPRAQGGTSPRPSRGSSGVFLSSTYGPEQLVFTSVSDAQSCSQILGVLITGMLVPYNDPELLRETGNAAQRWVYR